MTLPAAVLWTATALQMEPFDPDPGGIDVTLGVGGGAVGAFLTTLLVGAIMIAFAPDYVERMMASVREEPVDSFVYGLVCLLAVVVVTVALVVSIIGIVLAVPFVLLATLIWAVGAAIAFLVVGERLVGREDGWLRPLAVGAAINGGLALTGVGGLVSICVGAAGFGAVLRDWLE